MTTEKMPDVINITVSKNALGIKDYQVSRLKPNTRYIRAEHIKDLLKQARDEMNHMVDSDSIPYGNNVAFKRLIAAIEKFL